MSQPKSQLETFKAWAGKDSDISYYLNSHHIDVHESMVGHEWVPVTVTASASTGIAEDLGCAEGTEDTITLLVNWAKKGGADKGRRSTAVYTASWTAPQKAGLHSQQYFHYVASKGEVRVNQAKRDYEVTEDEAGLTWLNPFYMRYGKPLFPPSKSITLTSLFPHSPGRKRRLRRPTRLRLHLL